MKKETLRATIESQRLQLDRQRNDHEELGQLRISYRELLAEVKQMREHWRPVPITHEWQPRNPQCALCDEPRDSPRHAVDKTGD